MDQRFTVRVAQRIRDVVSPQVLRKRQPCRVHPLHDRPRAERIRRRCPAQSAERLQGPSNFRNLFVYSPNGKKDGIRLIPVSEVAAKDEFSSIKNQTRDDVLASLRIPPQLMGIVPQNAGGFGSIREAAQIFMANELEPIQSRMTQLNDWLGEEVVRFKPYEIAGGE